MTRCEEWLRQFLAMYGRVNVDVIRDVRKTMGFTRAEVNAAKKALGILVDGEGDDLTSRRWFWRLPQTKGR